MTVWVITCLVCTCQYFEKYHCKNSIKKSALLWYWAHSVRIIMLSYLLAFVQLTWQVSSGWFCLFWQFFKPGCGQRTPCFLKSFLCRHLYVCICVSTPEATKTSGVMWSDIDPIWLVKNLYCCYMVIIVGIITGCDFRIDMYHEN